MVKLQVIQRLQAARSVSVAVVRDAAGACDDRRARVRLFRPGTGLGKFPPKHKSKCPLTGNTLLFSDRSHGLKSNRSVFAVSLFQIPAVNHPSLEEKILGDSHNA